MGDIIFLSRRIAEGATITASSEQTTLPATNLIGPSPSKVWRSTGLSSVYIDLDLGASTAVDTLSLVAPNLTGSGTWRLMGDDDYADLSGTPTFDTGAVSPWPVTGKPAEDWNQHAPILHFDSQTLRYWRLHLADAGNAAGHLEAGSILIGPAITVTYNSIRGWQFGDDPASIVQYTTYGRTLVEDRDSPRVKSIPFQVLPRADVMAGLGAMLRERKTSKPFLVCVDPDATTSLHVNTIYGHRVGAWSVEQQFHELFSTGLRIKEHL